MKMAASTLSLKPYCIHVPHVGCFGEVAKLSYLTQKLLIEHLLGREAVGSWIQVSALQHASCVTLGQLMHLSGPRFSLL